MNIKIFDPKLMYPFGSPLSGIKDPVSDEAC
jgi:hypothetical protein